MKDPIEPHKLFLVFTWAIVFPYFLLDRTMSLLLVAQGTYIMNFLIHILHIISWYYRVSIFSLFLFHFRLPAIHLARHMLKILRRLLLLPPSHPLCAQQGKPLFFLFFFLLWYKKKNIYYSCKTTLTNFFIYSKLTMKF
jgi:hypothetical protein